MPTLEAPTIETFEPVKTYRALGVGYVSLRNPDGVELDLSETGALAADQNPDLAPLLARMGNFIAEHGNYKATIDIADREPGDILRVGERPSEMRKLGYQKVHLASVYHPESAEDVVIKAYDFDRKSAGLQFYLGAWLHVGLADADDGLASPAQLAMFRASRFGHRTTVMDYAPGANLYSLSSLLGCGHTYEQDISEVQGIASATSNKAQQKIGKIMGWRGQLVANDMRNLRNIIVADPETVTPDNMADRELTVIDQPVVKKINLAPLALARHLHIDRHRERQDLTPEYRTAA